MTHLNQPEEQPPAPLRIVGWQAVTTWEIAAINRAVQTLVADGWLPHGPLVVTAVRDVILFAQVMIRVERAA